VCDLETSRMGAPYIYYVSSLRVKDEHFYRYFPLVQLIEQDRRKVYISVQFEMVFNWNSLSTELYFGLKVEYLLHSAPIHLQCWLPRLVLPLPSNS